MVVADCKALEGCVKRRAPGNWTKAAMRRAENVVKGFVETDG